MLSHTRERLGKLLDYVGVQFGGVGSIAGPSRVLRAHRRAAIHHGALTLMTPSPSPQGSVSVYPSPQMRMATRSMPRAEGAGHSRMPSEQRPLSENVRRQLLRQPLYTEKMPRFTDRSWPTLPVFHMLLFVACAVFLSHVDVSYRTSDQAKLTRCDLLHSSQNRCGDPSDPDSRFEMSSKN